jgi:PadR family transcriptional regulator AphA
VVKKASPDLSLSDWVVLAVVAEGPTHGWPIVRELSPDGSLGRVWTVARAVVYRCLTTLAAAGYVEEIDAPAASRGPDRSVLRVTRGGRAAVRRWLETPVDHVRDVRTELLVKLALLDRAGLPYRTLVDRQIERLGPVIRTVSGPPAGDGFDLVLARWRREQAIAVERFLHALDDGR